MYRYPTRAVSVRLPAALVEEIKAGGYMVNRAANDALHNLIKGLQRGMSADDLLLLYGTTLHALNSQGERTHRVAMVLRLRHDYLDYIELQGLNRTAVVECALRRFSLDHHLKASHV